MLKKTLLCVIVVLLSAGFAAAATLSVGAGQTYTTIQSAVDAASPGDIISVGEGTYTENVVIKKNDIAIIGKNKEKTIIDSKKIGSVIRIDQASNVKISGFTIQNSGGSGKEDAGVTIYSAHDNMVANSIFTNNVAGISIYSGSNNNIIAGNDIKANGNNGIFVFSSSSNKIYNNNIQKNKFGIYADSARENSIYSNNFIENNNQAYDNSGLNSWDDGKSGNYWSTYSIQGNKNSRDNYQLSKAITIEEVPVLTPTSPQEQVAQEPKLKGETEKSSPGFTVVLVFISLIIMGALRDRIE